MMWNVDLAKMGIREAGDIFQLLSDTKISMPVEYYGNPKDYSSFRNRPEPGHSPDSAIPSDIGGWQNIFHRHLRMAGSRVAGLVDTEVLTRRHPEAMAAQAAFFAEMKGVFDGFIKRKFVEGKTGKKLMPEGDPAISPMTSAEIKMIGMLHPHKITKIPLKFRFGDNEFRVDIDNSTKTALSFLLGLKTFADLGGVTSDLFKDSMDKGFKTMMQGKNTAELTNTMGDIGEAAVSAASEKYDGGAAEKLEHEYFRLSPLAVKQIIRGAKALERDFQMLYFVERHDSSAPQVIDAVEWALRQAGSRPQFNFAPASTMEMRIFTEYLPQSPEFDLARDVAEEFAYPASFASSPLAYYEVRLARERVARLEAIAPEILEEVKTARSKLPLVEGYIEYLESPYDQKLKGELAEGQRRAAGRPGRG